MEKKELVELIESVKIDKKEFVILSTAALLLRGIVDTAKDLDIAVTKKGLEQLKENYNLIPKDKEWYKVNDMIECIQDDMKGKKELVDKYYLQDIVDYLKFLESSERQKDKDRIPGVKEYILKRK